LPIWTDFMSVALGEHPEWQGDWQMPAGIEQVAINPRTGGPAAADDPEKRLELFINGTSPQNSSGVEPEAEGTPETEEVEPTGDENLQPLPEASPGPSPKVRQPRYETRSTEGGRLEGTITLDVDPNTGLIAVESCPVIRTRTYVLGTEPKQFCAPQYHQRPSASPQPSRRGLTIP
jgi:hypothetical protein